mgnify:CR=1 FL=1
MKQLRDFFLGVNEEVDLCFGREIKKGTEHVELWLLI